MDTGKKQGTERLKKSKTRRQDSTKDVVGDPREVYDSENEEFSDSENEDSVEETVDSDRDGSVEKLTAAMKGTWGGDLIEKKVSKKDACGADSVEKTKESKNDARGGDSIEKKKVAKKDARDGDSIKMKKGACGKDSIERKKVVKKGGYGGPELLFFDFETTGICRDSHIIQIGAVRGEEKFEMYVRPKRKILLGASKVNGITYKDGVMRSGEEEVVCVGVKEALEEFCRFISADGNGSELVGHNIKNFDCKVLYHAVYRNEMMEEFSSAIKGFIDTYLVYKKVYPGLESYSLDKLNEKYIKEPRSPLHDALSDVQLTRKVYEIVKSDPEIQKSLFSWRSVVCACSLQPLVKEKIITQYMKNNLVKANLDYDDLLRAHSRPSGGGIDLLFSEKVGENKKPRVTNCKTTIKKVSDYFDKI